MTKTDDFVFSPRPIFNTLDGQTTKLIELVPVHGEPPEDWARYGCEVILSVVDPTTGQKVGQTPPKTIPIVAPGPLEAFSIARKNIQKWAELYEKELAAPKPPEIVTANGLPSNLISGNDFGGRLRT